jgi:hypothetical protein
MSNNLINLHKLKIFEGLTHGYTDIFNELSNIKNLLKKYPDYLKPVYLTTNNKIRAHSSKYTQIKKLCSSGQQSK